MPLKSISRFTQAVYVTFLVFFHFMNLSRNDKLQIKFDNCEFCTFFFFFLPIFVFVFLNISL